MMKMITVLTILLAGALVFGGCREAPVGAEPTQETGAAYRTITPADAKALLEQDPAVKLVDVRTEEEHRQQRIDGSLLIPYDAIEQQAPELLPDREQTIVLYCRSGRRSEIAANALLRLGYTRVFDLGGIIDWPYETVQGK
jgi:rhodanese-related sulfurtransferase